MVSHKVSVHFHPRINGGVSDTLGVIIFCISTGSNPTRYGVAGLLLPTLTSVFPVPILETVLSLCSQNHKLYGTLYGRKNTM